MPMPYRTLGNSDLVVSLCCLGTMTWGEQNTETEAVEQLNWAVNHGNINFIDTAELYPVPPGKKHCGDTELIIGRWLKAGGPDLRKKIILASKVAGYSGRTYIPMKRKNGVEEKTRLSREQIFNACESSLERLQTDYLDLYQLHWPDRYTPTFGALSYQRANERDDGIAWDEQVQAMGDLIKAGKIRHWGLSNENSFGVTMMVQTAKRLGVPPPVSIQNDFCLVDRRFEQDGTAEACSPLNVPKGGIGLLAYGALAGGTLSGKYHDGSDTSKSRHDKFPDFQPRYHAEHTRQMAKEFCDIATAAGFKPAQLALKWAADREYMGSVIIGATTMEQLKDNVAAFELDVPKDVMEQIDQLYLSKERPFFNKVCRMGRNNP